MHESVDLGSYKDMLLFLAVAAVIVPAFNRISISPILGYLGAGVLLGPFGLGALVNAAPWLALFSITDVHQVSTLGDFGIAFLLFVIGLELSWDRLLRMRKLVFGLGSLQMLGATVILSGIALVMGQPPAASLVIGGALAMSSTAIVLPSLAHEKRLNSVSGRATFGVLLFQDLSIAPFLFMVTMLSGRSEGGLGASALYVIVPAVLALAVILLVGRLLLRPLFQMVAATGGTDLFVAASLLVVVGAGFLTAASGQSMSLGAFVAGLLLAETEYRRQIEVAVQPFEGLLLGLFFLSVGARLDVSVLTSAPGQTISIALGLMAVKAAVILPLAMAMGLRQRAARDAALVLAPGGEFALVLISVAMAGGIVSNHIGSTAMVATSLSMALIPLIARISAKSGSGDAIDETDLSDILPQQPEAGQVIVVGYGRVGQLVGDMLSCHGISFLAIDRDVSTVRKWQQQGVKILFGDASRIELLRLCGIDTARALVVTFDSASAVEDVVTAARRERVDLTIVARARDAAHATKLYGLKVTDAVPETIEASLQLSEATLVDIGVPMGLVIASIHEKRDEFRRLLQSVDESGTPTRAIRARAGSRSRTDV